MSVVRQLFHSQDQGDLVDVFRDDLDSESLSDEEEDVDQGGATAFSNLATRQGGMSSMMLSTQKTKTRTMTRRKRTMKKQQTLEDLNNAVEKAYLDERM